MGGALSNALAEPVVTYSLHRHPMDPKDSKGECSQNEKIKAYIKTSTSDQNGLERHWRSSIVQRRLARIYRPGKGS